MLASSRVMGFTEYLTQPYTGTSAVLFEKNGVLQIFRVQLGKGAAGSGDPALPLLCGLATQEVNTL